MAWNPQGGGGGPWGSGGGGGPWGGNGGGKGPWGGGSGGNGGGGGQQPPDIEEMLKKSQDKLRRFMPGGFGTGKSLFLVVLVGLAVWMGSGFYRVEAGHQGVVMLFGKFVQTTDPGLNWYFPAPIGETLSPNVERINRIDVGFRGAVNQGRSSAGARDVLEESLMLTGDQNIADADFTVFWKVKDAGQFLFNIRDPETTVKLAAESAMREIIGQTSLENALTGGREAIEDKTRELLQTSLDEYKSGVTITDVKLLKVEPPAAVIDAFNEVQRAKQDQTRLQNEAEAYRNGVVPTARGEAARMIQEAEAYKEKVIKDAEGEAKRFIAVYDSWAAAKDVTSQRLYLETMQEVLSGVSKVLVDQAGQGVVPYLPLPELNKRQGGAK